MSEKSLMVPKEELLHVLKSSLYPGASDSSIEMVLSYCHAAGLDPMQKPVHIVPMWDRNQGQMRDVIMPGIGMYRIQASRSEQYAGVTEPGFGPDVIEQIGGYEITYPQWCKVTVKRLLSNGVIAEFTAREFWKENFAVKGGKEKSIAPNAMWARRPYGQLAKCAEAQALRKAFPEFGAQPTAEEMEGKVYDAVDNETLIPSDSSGQPKKQHTTSEFITVVPVDITRQVVSQSLVCMANGDAHGLKQIWDEFNSDEQVFLWRKFDSTQRSEMKKLTATIIKAEDK